MAHVRSGRPRWRRKPVIIVVALFIALSGVGVDPTAAAASAGSDTAEGWEFIRGAGAITETDREYNGEGALRVDYHFVDPYAENGNLVLAVRGLAPGERDWTGLEAIRFAVDGDDTAGLRAAAVHIQLLSAGGSIVQSPLITFDRSDWEEIELPLYRFKGLIGGDGFRWDEVLQERIVIRYQGGPFEPHSAYFGGWERVPDANKRLPDVAEVPTGTMTVALSNGTEIDLVVGADDQLLYGMAAARIEGTTLRTDDPERLLRPVVRTAEGRTHEAFRFDGIEVADGETVIRASALDSDVTLRWVFTPRHENVRSQAFRGFGYHYELASDTERFERVEEVATWELGGSSVGNTAVLRGSSYATEVAGSTDSAFDVSDYWHTRVRFAHGDAFDYQAGPEGQLYVGYDRADLIETTFLKEEGEEVFEIEDVYVVPETSSVATVGKHVLHAPGPVTGTVDVVNAHTVVRDAVYERMRRQYDISVGPILPQIAFYELDEQEPLDEILQNGLLDDAAEMGFKAVNLGRLWESDPENDGPSTVHGVTLWNFDIAEKWGGNEALGRVTDAAHERGLDVRLWAPSGQMSRNSPEVIPHPEWQVQNRYGALGGNYWSLAGIDMSDPGARGLLYNGLAERRAEQGVDGLWLDSLHDLGFHIFDHDNDPAAPHVEDTLAHLRDLREDGFNLYVEGYSPFGVASNLFEPERFATFYDGHEYRAYEMAPHFTVDPTEIDFYRFAANKAMPYNSVTGTPDFWSALDTNDELRDLVTQTNHDFNTVSPHLGSRRLLTDDRGVAWTSQVDKDVTVLFAFEEFDFRLLGRADVVDVTTGETVDVSDGVLHTEERHTYQIDSRATGVACSPVIAPTLPCGG